MLKAHVTSGRSPEFSLTMPPRNSTPARADSDHDLLIRIDAKVEILNSSFQQLQNSFGARVERLEKEAVVRSDLDAYKTLMERQIVKDSDEVGRHLQKHDKEIAFTLRMIYIAIGALAVLEILLRFVAR